MQTGISLILALTLSVLAQPAVADLPKVTEPGGEKMEPASGAVRYYGTNVSIFGRGQQVTGSNPGRRPTPSKLDILMKSLADPHTPPPTSSAVELRRLKALASLSQEEQNTVVPELLGLLSNTTELSSQADEPLSQQWRVQHRAALALAAIAEVHMGQFPMRERGRAVTQADRDHDRGATEVLRKRWQAWWAEAKESNDSNDRAALSNRLRASCYDGDDDEVFWANIDFALARRDPTPLPQLAERLVGPKADKHVASQRILNFYVQLCQLPDVHPRALLPLLEYIKANNPDKTPIERVAGAYNQSMWWVRNAGNHLNRLCGAGVEFWETKQVEIGDADAQRTATVQRVSDEALVAWEKAINEKIEAADAPPENTSDDDEPAGPSNSQRGALMPEQLDLRD